MSYKAETTLNNGSNFISNAFRFESEDEALGYAEHLADSNIHVSDYRVAPSNDEVRHEFVSGKVVRLELV